MRDLIFVDMDGVLVDWSTAAAKVASATDVDPWSDNPPRRWNVCEHYGITEEDLWERIRYTPLFWERLPVLPWAEYLIGCLSNLGEVFILSAPAPLDIRSTMGKARWIREYLPGLQDRLITCPGKFKHLLSRPGRFLVDDKGETCDHWTREGGRAALFPAPWNGSENYRRLSNDFDALLKYVTLRFQCVDVTWQEFLAGDIPSPSKA